MRKHQIINKATLTIPCNKSVNRASFVNNDLIGKKKNQLKKTDETKNQQVSKH